MKNESINLIVYMYIICQEFQFADVLLKTRKSGAMSTMLFSIIPAVLLPFSISRVLSPVYHNSRFCLSILIYVLNFNLSIKHKCNT